MENIISQRDKLKINFMKIQYERNLFLGEFKENVLKAIEKNNLLSETINPEIKEAMNSDMAKGLKIRRDLSFEYIKPYIDEAEKIGLSYILVDDIAYQGRVVIVVISKEAIENKDREVFAKSPAKVYLDAGLSEAYYFAEGKKISGKKYKELKEKLPERVDKFKKLGLLDKLFGKKCAIEIYETNKHRKELE